MSMFKFQTCIVCFFFVADVHMLILYICYSNSRFKSSLELMFMLYVSPGANYFSHGASSSLYSTLEA